MPEDNSKMRGAVGLRSQAIFSRLLAIHLRAHVEGNSHPLENRHYRHQEPEARRQKRGENDDDIKKRARQQNLDKALTDDVEAAAEITLKAADEGPDNLANQRQDKREEDRNAKSVEKPRSDIAPLIIGADIVTP